MARFEHSSGYLADQEARQLPRILHGGTPTAQAAAYAEEIMWPRPGERRDYYPAEDQGGVPAPGQEGSSLGGGGLSIYDDRVRRSVLPPTWRDNVRKSALAPLMTRITPEGWSDRVMEWWENLDGTGRNAAMVMIEILENKAVDGLALALADLERVEGDDGGPVRRSAGDDDRAGRRPYVVPLQAVDFDPISVGQVKGETVLLECGVYQEQTTRDGGPTTPEQKSALWRVFRLRGDGVYTQDLNLVAPERDAEIEAEGEERKIQALGSRQLTRIPITPFYGDLTAGAFRGRPPYGRPAELAIDVYRKRSDKDHYAREVSRLRHHLQGVPTDAQGNAKYKMQGNFLYSDGPGSVLETSGAALEHLRLDLERDEAAIEAACSAIAAERTSGDVTATEAGLRAVKSGTYQEVVTRGDARSIASMLADLETLGGVDESGGTVSWPYKSVAGVAPDTRDRLARLAELDGADGKPLFPVVSLLYLERAAGGLPEGIDLEKLASGEIDGSG